MERENAAFGAPLLQGRRIRLLVSLSSLRSRVERERERETGERPPLSCQETTIFFIRISPNLLADFPRISWPFWWIRFSGEVLPLVEASAPQVGFDSPQIQVPLFPVQSTIDTLEILQEVWLLHWRHTNSHPFFLPKEAPYTDQSFLGRVEALA